MNHRLLLLIVALHLLIADRAIVRYASGGSGVVRVMDLVIIACGAWAASQIGPTLSLRLFRRKALWTSVGPYLLMSMVLPFLGWIFLEFPARTVLSAAAAAVPCSFLIIGFCLGVNDHPIQRVARGTLFWVIVCQCAYAGLVHAQRTEIVDLELLQSLVLWDWKCQIAYRAEYEMWSRAVGTYISPNELGLWAVLSFWLSALLMSGPQRIIACGLTLAALFLSESRGSLYALLGSILVWSASELMLWASGQRRFSLPRIVTSQAAVAGLILCALLYPAMGGELSVSERLKSGASVLREGAHADANMLKRVQTWENAWEFSKDYPMGTLGSPEFLFGGYLDNEFVRTWLQGGPLYLLAYLVALLGGLRSWTAKTAIGRCVAIASAALAINALTALPLSRSPAVLFWLLFGYLLSVKSAVDVPNKPSPVDDKGEAEGSQALSGALGTASASRR
jgi:hypothetical protein